MPTDDIDDGLDRRRLLGAGLGVVGGAAALSALASPAVAAASDAEFWNYGPRRIVDSRKSQGTAAGKIRAGQTRTISLADVFNAGSNLTAVINLTVTQTEASGYLIAFQSGTVRPVTSNINWWGPNQTYGNLSVVGLRPSPVSFDLFCASGAAHFLVDVVGYFYRDGSAERVRPPVEKRLPG